MRETEVIRYLAGLSDQQVAHVLDQARSVTNSRRVLDSIADKLTQFPPMMGGNPEPLVSAPIVTAPKHPDDADG